MNNTTSFRSFGCIKNFREGSAKLSKIINRTRYIIVLCFSRMETIKRFRKWSAMMTDNYVDSLLFTIETALIKDKSSVNSLY